MRRVYKPRGINNIRLCRWLCEFWQWQYEKYCGQYDAKRYVCDRIGLRLYRWFWKTKRIEEL